MNLIGYGVGYGYGVGMLRRGGTPAPAAFQSVILSTDMCDDVDDVSALGLCVKYCVDEGINLLAVSVANANAYSAHCARVLLDQCGLTSVPVCQMTAPGDDTSAYTQGVAELQEPVLTRTSYPDSTDTLREILAAQPDQTVKIITMGYLTDYAALLQSSADEYSALNGIDLVTAKVIAVHSMASKLPSSSQTAFNLANDIPAATYVDGNTPVPHYWAPQGISSDVPHYIEQDGYSPNDPFVKAWVLHGSATRPAFDHMAVIHAFYGTDGLGTGWWTEVGPGEPDFTNGHSAWTADAEGHQWYLSRNVSAAVCQAAIQADLDEFMVEYGTPFSAADLIRAQFGFTEGSGQLIDQSAYGNDSTTNEGTWAADGLDIAVTNNVRVPADGSLAGGTDIMVIAVFTTDAGANGQIAAMDTNIGNNAARAFQFRINSSDIEFFHRYDGTTSLTWCQTTNDYVAGGGTFFAAMRIRPDGSMFLWDHDKTVLASATLGGTMNSPAGQALGVGSFSSTSSTDGLGGTMHHFIMARGITTTGEEDALIALALAEVEADHGITFGGPS